ncbi:MAG: exosortase/archaeosortase family protein [Verrucomicrobiota bacterium]|nr:exosortase/archaeosortase family protein [Verrucomicrobiota bacterium]
MRVFRDNFGLAPVEMDRIIHPISQNVMANSLFFKLPQPMQWAAWILLGLAGYLVFDQIHWWNLREDYSFGYIVPIFVGYVIFDRLPKITQLLGLGKDGPDKSVAPSDVPSNGVFTFLLTSVAVSAIICGFVFIGFGAVYRAAEGAATIASMMAAAGFAAVLLGMVFLVSDRNVQGEPMSLRSRVALAALFIFPAFIWLLSAPTFSSLEQRISTMLLNKVTVVVFGVFDFLGMDIIRQGSVLILPKGSVGVEDACSGIRSLTASLFAGSFMAAVFYESWFKKISLLVASACLAFFGNLCRSLFLTTWAYKHGSDSIEGFVHDATGYAVMGVTIVGLIGLVFLFNIKFEYDDPKVPNIAPPPGPVA